MSLIWGEASQAALGPVPGSATQELLAQALGGHGGEGHEHGDICTLNRVFAAAMIPGW